jgi:hypothetical protein
MKSDVGHFPFNELVSSDVPNSATNLQFIWTKVPENVDFFHHVLKDVDKMDIKMNDQHLKLLLTRSNEPR